MRFTAEYLAAGVARRLKRWVDRRLIGKVNQEVFQYSDCLVTVLAVNKFFKATRLCDIGAHKGHWSFVMQQLNAQLQSVVMFEPQAKLISQLKERQLGDVKKSIYQCALGDRERQVTLVGGTASASLYEATENQHHYFPGSTTRKVKWWK